MDAIKQWAFSVCAAMVACGLCQMLLPRSGMEKIFRTTVSVFFLCCLLSPLVVGDMGLRVEVREYAQADIDERAARLAGVVEDQTAAAATGELRKFVEEKLVQMGIKYTDIAININTNGQSDAAVSADAAAANAPLVVEITADQTHAPEHDRIRAELEAGLGCEVRLGYVQMEEG